jgi:hypothetical protein
MNMNEVTEHISSAIGDEDKYQAWCEHHQVQSDKAEVQFRVNAGGLLHVQVFLPEQTINRSYGYANKFSVPPELTAWLAGHDGEYVSFASPERVYIRPTVLVTRYEDGTQLFINIKKTPLDWDNINTTNAKSFVLDIDLTKEKNLQFLDAMEFAGAVTDQSQHKRFVPGDEEE